MKHATRPANLILKNYRLKISGKWSDP